MTPEKTLPGRLGAAWLDFWFPSPPLANLAAMRVGVGLVMVYVLLLRSLDLETLLGAGGLGGGAELGTLDAMAWRFSFFNFFESPGWLWSIHVAALTLAVAFLLGAAPTLTGTLTLLFHLSYGHRNPTVWLGVDGLLTLAMVYLILLPCGRQFSIPGGQLTGRKEAPPRPAGGEPEAPPWSGIALRALQIQLCILYFQSGLAKLNGGWLAGMALWHPRLVEKGTPLASETLQAAPYLLIVIPAGLALFELFYCVFIWLRGFRNLTIACAVVVHVTVGLLWDKLPFNLLMIIMNLAFLQPRLLDWFLKNLADAAAQGWRAAFDRP